MIILLTLRKLLPEFSLKIWEIYKILKICIWKQLVKLMIIFLMIVRKVARYIAMIHYANLSQKV
jgi:hypothetical protein